LTCDMLHFALKIEIRKHQSPTRKQGNSEKWHGLGTAPCEVLGIGL
jgi:hypothetical protein